MSERRFDFPPHSKDGSWISPAIQTLSLYWRRSGLFPVLGLRIVSDTLIPLPVGGFRESPRTGSAFLCGSELRMSLPVGRDGATSVFRRIRTFSFLRTGTGMASILSHFHYTDFCRLR